MSITNVTIGTIINTLIIIWTLSGGPAASPAAAGIMPVVTACPDNYENLNNAKDAGHNRIAEMTITSTHVVFIFIPCRRAG